MSPTKSAQHAAPYGSARDLPSYQELARQIQGGKLLTRFIGRKQRSGFLEIERQLDHLVDVVDRFYDRLGSRNWIFHELLPISTVEGILDETSTPEEAEQGLIGIYQEQTDQPCGLDGFTVSRGSESAPFRLSELTITTPAGRFTGPSGNSFARC